MTRRMENHDVNGWTRDTVGIAEHYGIHSHAGRQRPVCVAGASRA